MDAYKFIVNGEANELLSVLAKARCKSCGGTGEWLGDRTEWRCSTCDGTGWNKQAVREIIAAVDLKDSS